MESLVTGFSIYDAIEFVIPISDWLSAVGAWMKESGLWLFDVLTAWAMLLTSEWFDYLLSHLADFELPVITQIAQLVLVLNAWVPIDYGLQLVLVYMQIATVWAVMKFFFNLIPFI